MGLLAVAVGYLCMGGISHTAASPKNVAAEIRARVRDDLRALKGTFTEVTPGRVEWLTDELLDELR
jgi:hypothetical protein